MTYDKLEKKKQAAAKRKEDLELECKLYCESDSWEEFELKRTAAGIEHKCRPFDMFRRHYVTMDEGAFMCFLKYDWPLIAIPALMDIIALVVNGSFIMCFLTFMFTTVSTMLYHATILSDTQRRYFKIIGDYEYLHPKQQYCETVYSPELSSHVVISHSYPNEASNC